jgi:hypothetical protein
MAYNLTICTNFLDDAPSDYEEDTIKTFVPLLLNDLAWLHDFIPHRSLECQFEFLF